MDVRRSVRQLRRRLRRTPHRWLTHAKRLRIFWWCFSGIVGLGLLWIVVTGLVARSQATQLESQIAKVRNLISAGRIDDARRAAVDIPAMAHRAHRLTTGPAWWIASEIPVLGNPIDELRHAFAAADTFGGTVPTFIEVSTLLDPASLRAGGDTIRIAPIVSALPSLQRIQVGVDKAYNDVANLHGSWLSIVNNRKDELAAQLGRVKGYVDAAVRASSVLPTMLGQNADQRYFIALQSEAELRGTGGLPGAFCIAVTHQGTIRFEKFYSDTKMLPDATHRLIKTGLDFGAQFAAAYGASDPTDSYLDSNVSPNFPYAARIWAAMWHKVSGETVDGVLGIDPTALGYFLDAMGAVRVGEQNITGGNIVDLTQRDQYVLFPDVTKRKQFEVGVLRAVSHEVTSGAGNASTLLHAAAYAGSQRRLLVWSRYPAIEQELVDGNYGGAIDVGDRPFSGLIINNAASGKLDYYLTRSLNYSRTGCGPTRDVLATITLANGAPASGLPAYVTTRLDSHAKQSKPGDNRVLLDYYATRGAQLNSVQLNDKPSTAAVLTVDGHSVFRFDLELPQGSTQTIVLHLSEPAGTGSPLFWQQPGVTPLNLTTFNQLC